jgi:xanthine dehydrogenase iron-sulfur cluster and FAD-binding subunit A
MQSWYSFELDGEICRVEKENTHGSLAAFLSRLDPCFAHFGGDRNGHSPGLVVMGTLEGESHRFRVVDADLMMLAMLAGCQVWTPEGIRNAEPEHPVNVAFQERQFECGDERIDALIALTFEGYYRPDLRRQGQINDQFDAIVSRTVNAAAVRETVTQVFASTVQLRNEAAARAERAGQKSPVWSGEKDIFGDRFTRQLFRLPERGALLYVDGSKRRFFRPDNLVELLKLRREYPEAVFVAGGTSLARRGGAAECPELISLEGVKELSSFLTTEESWEIGAAVSLTRVAEQIGRECPPFSKVLRRFASRPVRNRATLGGYLATAWGPGQLAPLLMALNARVILLSAEGERDAPVSQFYKPGGGTILQPRELIRSVIIPRSNETVLAARGITSRLCDVYTAGPRRTSCEPYATASFAIELRDRHIIKAWLAYSGIAAVPERAREAEEFLSGKIWEEKTVIEALGVLNRTVEVETEERSPAEPAYRKQLVGTLFQKFFYQHPTPGSVRPEFLSATAEFGKLEEPFLT